MTNISFKGDKPEVQRAIRFAIKALEVDIYVLRNSTIPRAEINNTPDYVMACNALLSSKESALDVLREYDL